MLIRFVKMHGCGNDFMIIDARHAIMPLSPFRISALGDRRRGIGWDQLIVLEPPRHPGAVTLMRIFNPDGSAAGACGNATRCVAALLDREGDGNRLGIETVSGLLTAQRLADGSIEVDMGAPALGWQDIPLAEPCDTLHLPLPDDPAAVSMGNPHATLFVPDFDRVDPAEVGPSLEHHRLFPDRANIGFAQVQAPDRIRLRVWERGAGLTLACGSGACAALVNAHRRGLTGRSATLVLDGGTLHVEWRMPEPGQEEGHVLMTGPAVTAFHGSVDLSTYPI
jgi:diaminopimelate epimerase